MCDYSLHLVASRPAKIGDKLVTTKFNNSVTRGFAAVDESTVAVCLLPGGLRSIVEAILLDTMFDLPSLDGVDKVLISQQVVEGSAGPLYMHAARGGSVRAT